MWLMKTVSKEKLVTFHLLSVAMALTVVGHSRSLHAEASRINFATSSSELANDQRLMDAERTLLHSLAADSSEIVEPQKAAAAPRSVEQVKSKKASSEARATTTSIKASSEVAKSTIASSEAKPQPAKAIVETKGPSSAELSSKMRALEASNESVKGDLRRAQQRIALLEQQLDESRSQLAIAETEVTRLSGIVDSKTRASMGKYNVSMPAAPVKSVVAQPAPRQAAVPVAQPVADVRPPAADADLQVATVTVDKADLRLGPGKNHSAIMSLRRGSRLMVEARQGEWYRVFAPNGDRAWIAAPLVTFGEGASSLNDGSSVRVKGFTGNAEEEAFRRVHRPAN
jgi:hypothetical protein